MVHEGREAKEAITDIKYSPDGNTLLLACVDCKVYVIDIGNAYTLRGTFDRHAAPARHLDFSSDSQYIRSNADGCELMYADATTGAYIPAASSLRDVTWESFTCPVSWYTQGLHPATPDGGEVTSCDRSRGGRLLLSGDSFGRVALHGFPCVSPAHVARVFAGHAGPVAGARWLSGDAGAVTLGADDRCVLQWRLARPEAGDSRGAEALLVDDPETRAFDAVMAMPLVPAPPAGFSIVRPWLSTIVPPNAPQSVAPAPPAARLRLAWVHGYRAHDVHDNIRYTADGALVYNAGALGVRYDKAKHTQAYYGGHVRAPTTTTAVDPRGLFAATGELAPYPRVHIWSAATGAPVAVLPHLHRRGIHVIAFSQGPNSGPVIGVTAFGGRPRAPLKGVPTERFGVGDGAGVCSEVV